MVPPKLTREDLLPLIVDPYHYHLLISSGGGGILPRVKKGTTSLLLAILEGMPIMVDGDPSCCEARCAFLWKGPRSSPSLLSIYDPPVREGIRMLSRTQQPPR